MSPFSAVSRALRPNFPILKLGMGLLPFWLSAALAAETAPLEEVPPLTDEGRAALRGLPPLAANVVRQPNGAVVLNLNGEPVPLMLGSLTMFTPREKLRVRVWKEAGIPFVMVPYDLGMTNARYGWVTPPRYNRSFWDGPGKFVREDVETLLWRVLSVYPDARIILWPWMDVYPGWDEAHPGELMRNEEGKPFIVSTHFLRVGENPDRAKTERLAWSFFSPVFREQASDVLREFIATVQASACGRQVVGYVMGGGQDAQLYAWDPPNYALEKNPLSAGDYSESAIRAWREWLKKRYGSVKVLSRHWGVAVGTFDEIIPPRAAALHGPAAFFDPQTERNCVDWRRFLAEGRAELSMVFAKVAREAAGKDVLIGVSGGDGGARFGLTANGKLLRDPNINYLWHQATYGRRLPPDTGGINAMLGSHALHGKLFVADMDQRTWVTEALKGDKKFGEISINDRSVGRAPDLAALRSMWRRETTQLWAGGAGPDFHPLGGAESYEDDAIKEELRFLVEKSRQIAVPSPDQMAGDVAVIYDEASVSYLKGGLNRLHNDWASVLPAGFRASGVPARFYYADDFREGLVPPAKVYVFANPLEFDETFIREVEKLKGGGKTLVWLQGAGWAQRDDPAKVSDVLGLKVEPASRKPVDPVTQGVPEEIFSQVFASQKLNSEGGLGWAVNDAEAVILGRYPDSAAVGMACRDHGTWKTLFVGNSTLAPGFINAVAEWSGAWRLAPAGNVVSAGPGWVSVHPLTTAEVELRLSAPAALKAWWPETLSSPESLTHRLPLSAGTTYIFDLRPPAR
jgi:hypothetical protein